MAAPAFVAEYETAWNSNPDSITRSVTTESGDVLVLLAGTSNGGGTLDTPTGGGLTWTLRQSIHISTSWCDAYVWTADATSADTFDVTVTKSGGSPVWGFNVLRYAGSAGIGASSKANVSASSSTGVTLNITTTEPGSAVAFLCADWDTLSGASRGYRSVNGSLPVERTYDLSPYFTVYAATHADAGPAGAKTVGMTAPLGQKYSIVAVEILGAEDANQGEVAASLPSVAGSLPGVARNPGALTAAVPQPTGSTTGTAKNVGTWSTSTLQRVAADIVGTATTRGTLTGQLPGIVGAVVGDSPGMLHCDLPKLTGTAAGQSTNPGTIAGTLPAIGVDGMTTATTANPATLDGHLSTVVAELDGATVNPATLTALLPQAVGAAVTVTHDRNITIIAGPVTCGWDAAVPLKGWSATQPRGGQWAGEQPAKGWAPGSPVGGRWSADKPTATPWSGDKPVRGWIPGPVTK